MLFIPEQGDIILLSFVSSSDKEIMKRKPAYVISRKIFYEHTGLAIIAPIASDEISTKGAVLVHQLKSLDFYERDIVFIEKLMQKEIKEITELAKLLIE